MNNFNKVKSELKLNISDDFLCRLIFEKSRYFDSQFTQELKLIKKETNIIYDAIQRKLIRKKYYFGDYFNSKLDINMEPLKYSVRDIEIAFDDFYKRLHTYDSNKIINSLKKKIDDLHSKIDINTHMKDWLNFYKDRQNNYSFSFASIYINQKIFVNESYNENIIINFINNIYNSLENYRHLAIIIDGEIFNENKECITWKLLYKCGVYAENFIQFKDDFFPFKKEKQINDLKDFLKSREIHNSEIIAKDFYNHISTGFKFEDCYISNNQNTKILIFKKIALDKTNIPCPSCNTTIQSGNSYPEMFLKSWECKNPSCPDRSKSGRGKRFDEFGTYRYFKLAENKEENRIKPDVFQDFRRDIFKEGCDYLNFLVSEYTFSNEKILLKNISLLNPMNRIPITFDNLNLSTAINSIQNFESLPIYILYKTILDNKALKTGANVLLNDIEIFNDDSASLLQTIKKGQIGTAMTSPPYYNAREYSQWTTMIMYFVDMLINCKVVYNALADNSYYLYNIGDIVLEDNIYVKSNMSKHRIQLGFLSSMIFEIAGYNLTGNIIWDKGEVQSKRNSTTNLFSGYVKCINCYEHILIFRKGKFEKLSNHVERITPVIKINNKGINTYKHTAPYPLEIVELIKPYVQKNLYILDPFLGSGTTLKWCKNNNLKGIGIEMNEEYYNLSLENLSQKSVSQFLCKP